MKIEIAIQVHFFQRRLCWMLSSILQQKGDIPEIAVSITCLVNNGQPTTEQVVELFRARGMNIKLLTYPDVKVFQYRGLTRNRQLAETDADWLLYADSDMTYPDNFFSTLKDLLQQDEYRDSARCLYSGRGSLKRRWAERLVDKGKFQYPCVVPDAHARAASGPYMIMPNVGAGFCQIVNVEKLKTRDGYYIHPRKCRDWSWETKYQKARSDMQFRRRLGRTAIPLPLQIHLQHKRDYDTSSHIEVQR